MAERKSVIKERIVASFRVDKERWNEFVMITHDEGLNASYLISKFVDSYVKEHKEKK